MVKIYLLLLCYGLLFSSAAIAGITLTPPSGDIKSNVINGSAKVIDGDTIKIGEQRIKLAGIDAVELHQKCLRDGVEWNCGEGAKAWLEHFSLSS